MRTPAALIDDPMPTALSDDCVDELRVPLEIWTDPACPDDTTETHIVRSID